MARAGGDRHAPGQVWEALERSAGPPSLCNWTAAIGVSVVAALAALLVLLGGPWPPSLGALVRVPLYAVSLALFCTYCICAFRGILERLSTRESWAGAWLLVLLVSLAYSYLAGLVGAVLGIGPPAAELGAFVNKSVIASGCVSLALFRYLYIRAQWQSEILAESEARVEALQARIRPHFLFNSLNTIASLIHDEPARAERATEDLAALFRGGMRSSDDMIPLADELDLARKYLAMEERRLGERIAVEWDVGDLPVDEPVLPMLLQPLLENAVAHGIQPRPEGGTVQVSGRREHGKLVITVVNPLAPTGSKPGHGMALGNIRSRLALTYSSLASLLTHQDDESFYAVLTLPHAETPDR